MRIPLTLLLVSTTAALCQPIRTFALATGSAEVGDFTRVAGHTGQGDRGTPVAGGADRDGDGLPDMGLASMHANPFSRSGAGTNPAVVPSGTAEPTGVSPDTIDVGNLLVLSGRRLTAPRPATLSLE